ncbi:MAG: heavy metal translocating P-type ATPase metal-binding domain-containing protein [Desulfuromonadales bacterium]
MTKLPESVCSHCGITFRWKPLEEAVDDGSRVLFCCRGCQGAHSLICSAGLAHFYQRGDRAVPTVGDAPPVDFTAADLARHVVAEADYCRIDVMIGGITCPSCVWLLERMLGGLAGVVNVSISYSGGVAALRFEPALVSPLEIFSVISRLGYLPRPYAPEQSEKDARRERDDLLLRFGTALFLTMQLMAYSYALYAGYFQGMAAGIKQLLQYVSLLVTTPVVFYSGYPFLAGAWRSVRTRAPGMDLLISVGALSAWFYSLWATFSGEETYFESAATIITFVLIGRLLELSVRRRAMSGISALYASAPQRATLAGEGSDRQIEVADVKSGDLLLVRQGERFPVDCLIVEGETEVDQSLATGESIPVVAVAGSEIRSGCVNVAAPVTVQALRPVGQSYLMRVAALVQMAQAGKPRLQQLADLVSGWFVPAVIMLAVLVGIVRYTVTGGGLGSALMTALAVILIACPCAMGLAVPAAVLAACSRAAALGIILRGGDVIERLAAIDIALFDKTGTITRGKPDVSGFCPCGDFAAAETEVIQAAASIENRAAHPLAGAIVTHAAEHGCLPQECSSFRSYPGRGISGVLPDGRDILCGNQSLLKEHGVDVGTHVSSVTAGLGDSIVFVVIGGRLAGRYSLRDQLRDGGSEMVSAFMEQGIEVRMISGDNQEAVNRIAAEIGLTMATGEMTPDDKLACIESFQAEGRSVLMAGDGINDAPALAAASVSCSLTGSSDIALENADVIITGDDISRISTAHGISRATITIIKQNLAWAFLYNIIGIPLAMSGMLTPVYAAVAMTASSMLVSLNSLRLMGYKQHG